MATAVNQQNKPSSSAVLPLGVHFQTISRNESARRGNITFSSSSKSVDTPNLILYTRKGSPINLTPDLLTKLKEANTLQIGFQEMYPDVEALKHYDKGIHKFVHLEDKVLFVSFRDPTEYVEFPVSEKHMNFNTKSGKKKVDPKEFMDMQKAIRADFFESLSVDVPHYISSKRIKKSVDTSLAWLDQSLKLQEKESTIFGVIQGGSDLTQRIHSAKETNKRNVAGFVLGSFGLGETQEQRAQLVGAIVKEISDNKPRIAPGLGNPEEVLQGVELGIDLFSTNYPSVVTEWGCAFTFSLSAAPSADDGKLGYKINLHNRVYQLDATPLVHNCPCYTCQNHTKAYIHHLLNVHELLATVLLTIHNTYHYLEFFKTIRGTLENNTFKTYKNDFLNFVYFQTIDKK